MVPDLFRIGRRETPERRPGMAPLHSHGRVLPKRPAANVDWLVRAASTALVSLGDGSCHAWAGTRIGVDDVSSATLADHLLLHRHAMADRSDSYRELYVPQLPGSFAGRPAAGR